MRVTRMAVPILCFSLLALPAAARVTPTISSVTASTIHRNSGEYFVRVVGTRLSPISGVAVEFAGPPGTYSVNASAGTDSYVDVWVPEAVVQSSGSYTVQVKATDAYGTVSSNTLPFRITGIVRLDLISTVLAEAITREGGYGRFDVSAISAFSDVLTINCSHKSGEFFVYGETIVDCYAEDDLGNAAKGSFTVSVADRTPPSIKTPVDLTAFGDSDGANVYYEVSASDAVDPEAKPVCSPESGSFFRIGTSYVSCGSKDAFGNVAKTSFRVHVGDEARPALILPETVQAEMESREGAYVSFKPTAVDIKGNQLDVNCSPSAGSLFPPGPSVVKCTSERAFGEFTVNVADTTAPYLEVPRELTAKAQGPEGAKVTFEAFAKDSIDGEARVSCAPSSGSLFAVGKTTVDCTSADSSSNSASASFVLEVLPYVDPNPWETFPGYEYGTDSPGTDTEPR